MSTLYDSFDCRAVPFQQGVSCPCDNLNMVSWPMTLDFLQFLGHVCVIEVTAQNAGVGTTHKPMV